MSAAATSDERALLRQEEQSRSRHASRSYPRIHLRCSISKSRATKSAIRTRRSHAVTWLVQRLTQLEATVTATYNLLHAVSTQVSTPPIASNVAAPSTALLSSNVPVTTNLESAIITTAHTPESLPDVTSISSNGDSNRSEDARRVHFVRLPVRDNRVKSLGASSFGTAASISEEDSDDGNDNQRRSTTGSSIGSRFHSWTMPEDHGHHLSLHPFELRPKPAATPIGSRRSSHSSRLQSFRMMLPGATGKSMRVLGILKPLWGSTKNLRVEDAGDDLAFSRRCSVNDLIVNTPESMAEALQPRTSSRLSTRLWQQWTEPVVAPETGLSTVSKGAGMDDVPLHPWIFNHESTRRDRWNMFIYFMTAVEVVLTPLSLSFSYNPRGVTILDGVAAFAFAIDFGVNMLSSFVNERGVVVAVPAASARHYLTSWWAIPDLCSWFPFELLFFSDNQSRFLGIAKIMRLARVGELARRVLSARRANIFRFLRLAGVILLVSHCCSCFWHWIAVEWRNHEDDWATKTLLQKYVHCWSLVIGCLNASPPSMYTMSEELAVAGFMLLGNLVQASVFGSVAVVISSFDEDEAAYKRKVITTYERCKFLDIPTKLTQRIQTYYEHMFRQTKSINGDADSFIHELSPALVCEVKYQLYKDMLKQIPFFSGGTIDSCVLEQLVLHLRTVVYMQDDIVIRKGEYGDWMGFVGCTGSVGVLDPHSQQRTVIRILRKGDYFGETALLQRTRRTTTAVALMWVQIHVLCRKDLDEVKEMYPEQEAALEAEIRNYMKAKAAY